LSNEYKSRKAEKENFLRNRDVPRIRDIQQNLPSIPTTNLFKKMKHVRMENQPPPKVQFIQVRAEDGRDELQRKMLRGITKFKPLPDKNRLHSLNAYMGHYVYDTYEPTFTPWDFIQFKECQQLWRRERESNDIPPAVFFTAKCDMVRPAKDHGTAHNFSDEIEDIFEDLRSMPPQPRVMQMGEMMKLKVNRGLVWSHEHRPQVSGG
jgi:hypothetical protein